MTEIRPTAAQVSPPADDKGFSRAQAFRSIAISIVINAVMPYVIYRTLEPHYPHNSLTPLLVSTVFPLFGLLLGLARKRSADFIAIISLVEIAISIIVTLVASNVEYALIARALQGTLTGVFFLATIAFGRPLLFYIARQFVAASSPAIVAGFEAAHTRDGGQTFRRLTAFWGVGLILISGINLALAVTVLPANYLLLSPILSIGTNVVMIWWTIRYSSQRFTRQPAA